MPIQNDYSHLVTDLSEPFENIALSFSGGGFRAASYALGVLSYFNYFEATEESKTYRLLEKVSYLSSTSGGTITTALYSYYLSENKSFKEFYNKLFEELEGMKLLNRVFEILNNKNIWNDRKTKRRNLINAFALAYDELLFDSKELSDLIPQTPNHLDEVCFNASEFYRGLLYRQAIKLKDDSKQDETFLFGNFLIKLKSQAALKLKISDILAASSCFPAGFEPIIFPDDFAHKKADTRYLLNNLEIVLQEYSHDELSGLFSKETIDDKLKNITPPVTFEKIENVFKDIPVKNTLKLGLMDGGITDNQGLESMIRANERRIYGDTSFKPFDLMLVNDVSSHYMDPYTLPHNGFKSGISINSFLLITTIIGILGISGIIACFFGLHNLTVAKIAGLAGILLFVLSLNIFIIIKSIKHFIREKFTKGSGTHLESNFSPEMITLFFKYFSSTPIAIIVKMIKERVTSVLTLNNDIYMKRIRQLLYQRIFEFGKWHHRVKTNHLYDLSFTNDRIRRNNNSSEYVPGQAMQIISEEAFSMATTLWFDQNCQNKNMRASIIACGQFTTCYNLLQYIEDIKKSDTYNLLSDFYKNRLSQFEEKLSTHFDKFNDNPFWLYNQLGEDYKPKGWKSQDMKDKKMPENFKDLR
jgi:hypothetical protein